MYNRRFPVPSVRRQAGNGLILIRIMIAIIAEKPSVGQEIARVVGATEKKGRLHNRNRQGGKWGGGFCITGVAGRNG